MRNWRRQRINRQPRHLSNINNSGSNRSNRTTLAVRIATDEVDGDAATEMAKAAMAVVQAAAEPVVVGLDNSNPEQPGQETRGREYRQTPTHTSNHVHET